MIRIILLLMALVISVSTYPAQIMAWEPVVLKAISVRKDNTGKMTITLSSGTVIVFPSKDKSDQWTKAVVEAMKKARSEKVARSSADPPSDSGASAMIKSKCAREWPDDFSMRKYCQDKQYEGLWALRNRNMSGKALSMIRSKCAREWPDDFSMRNYCENQQLKALRALDH